MNNDRLRHELRRRRQQLSREEQRQASMAVAARILGLSEFKRARRIAAYVGSKGELDPMPLLHLAFDMGKACYLPVLHPFLDGRLWFVPWTPLTPMQFNRFDIPEPVFDHTGICKPQWLDLVLTPVLGFDEHCRRLGMGGGFYDRTFAMKRFTKPSGRPWLLGIAHDVQRCTTLSPHPWDVALNSVITPTRHYRCTNHNGQVVTSS